MKKKSVKMNARLNTGMNTGMKPMQSPRAYGFFKLSGFILALMLLALNYTDEMRAIRSYDGIVFANSSGVSTEHLQEIPALFKKHAPAGGASEVSGSLDERLGAEGFGHGLIDAVGILNAVLDTTERAQLIPCGDSVGISIRTDGVLVVGFSEIETEKGKACPAKQCGLRAGDIIKSIDGRAVCTAEELSLALDLKAAEELRVKVNRSGKTRELLIKPIAVDGEARIGAWVRDSTIGIGTLSYASAENESIAALGHAVMDADTSTLIPVLNGSMYFADVLGVSRGSAGAPGEIKGTFSSKSRLIGSIEQNGELGVYGFLTDELPGEFMLRNALEVAFPDEVHTGDAYILSQTGAGGPESYACKIIRTVKQRNAEPKGLVIEITDERLLSKTGGIVRGMSGSPIIQDGRIAGIVTHVFINDPAKGYGAYAFWMYNTIPHQKP